MKRLLAIMIATSACLVLSSCAVPPGQVKRQAAPGQVKKYTGCNYRSGKCKLPMPTKVAKVKAVPNVNVWDLYD